MPIGADPDDGTVGDFGLEGAPVGRVRHERAGHPSQDSKASGSDRERYAEGLRSSFFMMRFT